MGPAAARNAGIRASCAEYVFVLESDDRIAASCLESLAHELDADPALECAYADHKLFGRSDEVDPFPGPPNGGPLLRLEHSLPGTGTLFRRSLWERLGGYDEADALRGRDDFEFWIRAFSSGCRAKRLTEPLYERRILHATTRFDVRDDEIAAYIYGKHRALFDRAGEARGFRCASLSRAARASYLRGDRKRAFRLAMRACMLAPSRSRLTSGLRSVLSHSTNAAIDAGAIRRAIPFVGYPLRGEARYRPFFVIGMGRSGNTLLRRILTSHSALHVPPETFVLGECIRRFRTAGRRSSWPDLVSTVMARFAFHPEFFLFEMDLAPLVQRLQHLPAARAQPGPRLRCLLPVSRRRVRQGPCALGGQDTDELAGRRAGARRPARAGSAPACRRRSERLLEVFPDAQFLHICRDGCDVVYSALRGGFFDDLEAAAQRWLHVESQTRRFSRRHADRSLDLRYEDLVARPEEVVRSVCAFLGVEFEPAMLTSEAGSSKLGDVPAWFWHAQVAKPINAANVGKARRMFSRAEREELQRLLGPALEELGYPARDGRARVKAARVADHVAEGV